MKNKIVFKTYFIICLSFLLMSITFWGIKQRISLIYYFLKFIISKDKTDYNLYKALSHGFIGLKEKVIEQNRREFISSLIKQKSMSAKQRSQNRITLIVDDSCDGLKYSKRSNKLHKSRDNSIKKTVRTHTVVFLVFTIGIGKDSMKYTIDFRLWRKGGKKKAELFIDMVTDLKEMLLSHGIDLTDGYFENLVIVFDSGYSYEYVLEKLDSLGFYFVGKYHHKKKHLIFGKEEIVTKWLRNRFRVKDFNCVNSRYKITCGYYRDIEVSDSRWRFLLCLFKRKGHKKRCRRFLVSNLSKKAYFTIIERYQQRYYIESIFRDLKQLYDFKEFHRNDLGSNFDDYLSLCLLRYDLIQKVKRENHLHKKSNGYVVKLVRIELNQIDSYELKNWFSSIVKASLTFSNTT
jgi:hypothetical protein